MMLSTQLSVRLRRSSWFVHYPNADFWEPWHMAVLHHGGMGGSPPPHTVMADLYHPARPQVNAASNLLLAFEKRTMLGHLPSELRLEKTVPQTLLDDCHDVFVEDLPHFWGNLDSHVRKHLNVDEQPHMAAAARAIRAEVRQRGLDPDAVPGFFPTDVADTRSYAALARAILYVALLPHSPLRFRLYSARGDYAPYAALNLNIDVPESFLASHGEDATQEVVLGVSLANAEKIDLGGNTGFVPILGSWVEL